MKSHTHPCSRCQQPVRCDGDLERNHDGWPATICALFHLLNGETALVICDECEGKETA